MIKNNNNYQKNMKERYQNNIKKISSLLKRKYGYKQSQFKENYHISDDVISDLVILDESGKCKIVIEVKSGEFVLPLFEHQLKEMVEKTESNFGILYNGNQFKVYQFSRNNLVEIDDIPNKKDLEKLSTSDIVKSFKTITSFETQIFRIADIIRGEAYDTKPLLQILALKILKEEQKKKFKLEFDIQSDELFDKAQKEFPNLFTDTRILKNNKKSSIKNAFELIESFSIKDIKKEIFMELILKIYLKTYEWVDFPTELDNFIVDLLKIKNESRVFIPYFVGTSFFNILNKIHKNQSTESGTKITKKMVMTEMNVEKSEIFKLISMIIGIPVQIIPGDYLDIQDESIKNNDKIILLPPIATRISRKDAEKYEFEYFGIDKVSYILLKLFRENKIGTKVALLVPPSFLYSHSNKKIRQEIIDENLLKGIIQFPGGILKPYSGIPLCLIILEINHKTHIKSKIFCADLQKNNHEEWKQYLEKILINYEKFEKDKSFNEDNYGFIVSRDELVNKSEDEWNINDKSPEMKKLVDIKGGIELREIGKIIFAKAISIQDDNLESKNVPVVRITDLDNGLIRNPLSKTVKIDSNRSNLDEIGLHENDILISCKGTIGKVAIARNIDSGHLFSTDIAIIRANTKKVLPDYLLQVLASEIVEKQLKIHAQGMIPRLSRVSFEKIVIPLPDISKQRKDIEKFKIARERIDRLEKELIDARKDLANLKFED